MIIMKSFASCIPLCQQSFESRYARLCSKTAQHRENRWQIAFNLTLVPQFSSHLNESCYTSNVSEKTLIRGDQVDDRSHSKTLWWGDSTDAQRIYLCQQVLSSVDDSSHNVSHRICNVHNFALCALKIKIDCMFLFILVYLLYEYTKLYRQVKFMYRQVEF